jgi:predicted ferric reductase
LGSITGKRFGLTNGELLFSIVFIAFLFGTFGYVFGHWYAKPHIKWRGSATSERWGRCLGQTALFPMGLMILPISRNSIWAKLMDYSWENMLKFHKCMSIAFLILSAAHMFAFWGVFGSMGDFPQALMDNPNHYRPEDATIAVNQALFIAVIIPVFCGLTLPLVRRFYFEWFYYTHFLANVLFCAILWHADFAWMYIIPGLVLYMIDHMVRFCKMIRPIEVISLKALPHDVTEIKFGIQTNPGWSKPQDIPIGGPVEKKVDVGTGVEAIHFESGQFVWLQIPEVDQMQSHPFNITCSQFDPYSTVFVKSQGENTWTGKLYELAKVAGEAHPNNPYPIKNMRLFVDGPYGNRFPYEKYNSILLIAGGIGITGVHSILRTLIQICNSDKGLPEDAILRKVRLVWVMKDPDLLYGNELLMYTLQMIPPLEGSPEYNKLMWGGAPPPPSPNKKKKRKSKTKPEAEAVNTLVIEEDDENGVEFTERDFSFNQGKHLVMIITKTATGQELSLSLFKNLIPTQESHPTSINHTNINSHLFTRSTHILYYIIRCSRLESQ